MFKFSLRSILAAVMLGAPTAIAATKAAARPMPRGRSSRSVMSLRSNGKHYPEQSSRQAMRAFRRQQGGPGIVLDPNTHQYVPRKD